MTKGRTDLSGRGRGLAFFRMPVVRALLALVFILLLGIIFNGNGSFYNWGTHVNALRQASVFGILACGMTIVIIGGGIDLAVGSVLGLVAVAFSIMAIHWQWNPFVTVLFALLLGLAAGAVSGGLVARFQMQPFIATLAMMVFARGLAKLISGGQKISTTMVTPEGAVTLEVPGVFKAIEAQVLGGNVFVVTLIFLACLLISWVLLRWLRPGRYVFAVGGNEEAARLSGVPVGRTKVIAYGMSGMFAAVAGMCQAAQEYQGDPEAGWGYELNAIAIVVIGGTSLMGGRGSVILTLIGTLTIGYLEKILSINAVSEAWRLMLTGAIIVVAVMMQRVRK